MANEFDLHAEFRNDLGKGASRRLRRDGKVPGVLYGGNQEPRALTLTQQQLMMHTRNEAFFSHVLTIKVGDDEQAAIVKDMQRHPAKKMIMHIDFQRIVAGEEIRMTVPLHFEGGEIAPGVKKDGGVISQLQNDVDIACLPKDLPEYLKVDVSAMEMDDMLHMSDIVLPPGVEIPDLAQGEDFDQPIVSLHRPHKVEEDEPEEEAAEGAADVPVGPAPDDADD